MRTVPALFLARCDRDPETDALFVPEAGEVFGAGRPVAEPRGWRALNLRESLAVTAGLAARLAALGVEDGVPVGILARSSYAWVAVDLAVLGLGGITVGLYPTLTGEQVAWQLRHAGARVLVVEDAAQAGKVLPLLEPGEPVRHVVSLRPAPGAEWGGRPVPLLRPAAAEPAAYRGRAAALRPEQPATIVYTSGTTGPPKGAVLTHANFVDVVRASADVFPTRPGDRSVVFLPLAHSLQRFAVYRGLAEQVQGWFAPSIDALPGVLRDARPDVLVTVPRMLEKVRAAVEARAASRGPAAARVLDVAIRVGRRAAARERAGRRLPPTLALARRLADRAVLRKVRAGLGGNLRVVISGGAPLSVEVAEWFEAVGIHVCEGWGLTETCAPATLNPESARRLGTVGPPLPGVELRLADDGEVLVRGPGVFAGYHADPEATAAALDAEGFFRTGDLGVLDEAGYLRITGRKKEIIVTAGGKNIAPANIEKALEGGPVEQAMVVGDARPYLVALVVPSSEAGREPAAAVARRVAAVNARLAPFETVKRFALLDRPFSVEGGELTPTLKLRRSVVAERHAALIEALYAGGGHAPEA